MALSGSVRTYEAEGRSVELQWTATQDITNNKSTLTWTLIGSGSSSEMVMVNEIRVSINGSIVLYKDQNNHTESWIGTILGSGTTDILHDSDGTKIFGITVEAGIYQWSINTSGTSVFTLDVIPRASKIILSSESVIMGQTLGITLDRASANFNHTLRYVFGDVSGTIAVGVSTHTDWNIPLNFANQIPNSISGLGTIICQTFNGNTLIGTETIRFSAIVPSNIIPSILSVVLEDPTGIKDTFNGFVQTKSKIKVSVNSTGAYGSTITKTEISVNGVKSTQNPYISGLVTESGGTKNLNVVVTDSRGRTKSSNIPYTVLSYIQPTIEEFNVHRCDSNGALDDSGEYIKITFDCSITSLNNLNNKNIVVRLKKQSSDTWVNVVNIHEYSKNDSVVVAAEPNDFYEVSCVVADSFGSAERNQFVSDNFTLLDFNSSGKGIAIGKASEMDALEINLPVYINGVSLEDYIRSIR